METKDHVSCGIHRSHAPANAGLCLVASRTVTDGVILSRIGIFVCKGARRSAGPNGSGRHQGSLRIPGRSAPEFRCSAGSQSRYAPDGRAGGSSPDGVVTQLGTDQAPSNRAEAGHGERVTQHPAETFGLKGSAHGPGGTLADAPGSSPGCGSQDVAALPRERSDASGHGGRGPALNNRESKPFRSRIILSSDTGARKAECPAKNCG